MKTRKTVRKEKAGEVTSFKGLRQTLASGLKNYRAVRFTLTMLCALSIYLLASSPMVRAQNNELVPGPCKAIQTDLNNLISERDDLQAQLKVAAPGEKSSLGSQVKVFIPKITAKQNELNACAKAHGGLPDVNTTFKGTATMTTNNPKVKGPFVEGVNIGAVFPRWFHDQIFVTSFPTIKVGPFSTPVGDNTTTVTLVDSGKGPVTKATGEIEITAKLHFHHSLALAGDSDLTITLSTETSGGSRLKSGGALTLAGSGTFDGGYLDGNKCTLIITGALSQLP